MNTLGFVFTKGFVFLIPALLLMAVLVFCLEKRERVEIVFSRLNPGPRLFAILLFFVVKSVVFARVPMATGSLRVVEGESPTSSVSSKHVTQ